MSPRVLAQGQTSHSYTIDLSLRKTFLDRKLALAFNVRDLLNSRARRNTSESASFWQYSENQWNSRQISLSLTYNFGNTKKNKPDRQGMDSSMDMNSYEDTGSDY